MEIDEVVSCLNWMDYIERRSILLLILFFISFSTVPYIVTRISNDRNESPTSKRTRKSVVECIRAFLSTVLLHLPARLDVAADGTDPLIPWSTRSVVRRHLLRQSSIRL